MQYAIVKRSADKNRIESVVFRELTETAAENMSEVAAVVSMVPSMGGMSTVYIERVASQCYVNHDELYELARKSAQMSRHNGWIS